MRFFSTCCFKVLTRFLLLLLIVAVAGPEAMGQRRRVVKPKTKKGKGKILDVRNELLQVQDTKSGDIWVISPVAASMVEYTAHAKKDWIRKGMMARVTATFDRKGQAQEAVDLVQIFTPRPDYPVGAELQEDKPNRDVPQEYLVAGIIKRIDSEGKVTVNTGKKQFTFDVADDAEVEVNLINDLDWVQTGDKIQFDLRYMQQGEAMIATASIEAAQPLEGVQERPTRRRRKKKRRVPSEEAEDGETAEAAEADSAETEVTAAESGSATKSAEAESMEKEEPPK